MNLYTSDEVKQQLATMKIQFAFVVLCSIFLSSLVAGDQITNIEKLNKLIESTRLILPKTGSPKIRPVVNNIAILHETIRRVLELYGLNFLIHHLNDAQVVLNPNSALPDSCFLVIKYVFTCLNVNPPPACYWHGVLSGQLCALKNYF